MTWPTGLSALELSPFFDIEQARSRGGFAWEVEESDPRWSGSASTSKLNSLRLQLWEAFRAKAEATSEVIEFVDPVYFIPAAYRAAGTLPGGWNGLGELDDEADAWAPVLKDVPVGIILTPGDRLGFEHEGYKSYHMVGGTAPLTVTSATAQAVPIVPPLLPNLIAAGAVARFLDPVIRLRMVPGTWKAPRRSNVDTIATFQVEEATIQE